MDYLGFAYSCYFICYILEISSFLLYFKLVANEYIEYGVKFQPYGKFVIHNYFFISFIAFICISMLHFSKRQEMFIPFIVLQGNTVINVALNLPYSPIAYVSIIPFILSSIGFCVIIYYNKQIFSYIREYEYKKINLTENQIKGRNVSKN